MTARRESFQRVRVLTLVLVHVSIPFGCPHSSLVLGRVGVLNLCFDFVF
jgi:hypothetical protein